MSIHRRYKWAAGRPAVTFNNLYYFKCESGLFLNSWSLESFLLVSGEVTSNANFIIQVVK
jgi:hypothetical protein